jgi:hypothetical protein
VVDERGEVFAAEGLEVDATDDARRKGSMVLHPQARGESRQADKPDGEQGLAVEGVVEEAAEVDEEAVGEKVRFIEHQNRERVLLLDEVDDGPLELPPELGAAMGRLEAQLERECAVEVEGGDSGIAHVEQFEVGLWQLFAEVADGGRFANAGLGGEHAKAGLVEQVLEGHFQAPVALGLVEEAFARRVPGQQVMGEPESGAIGVVSVRSSRLHRRSPSQRGKPGVW